MTPCSSCSARTKSPSSRPEHALHRPLLQADDMNLDIPGAQRRRGLEPDEARADHDRAARAVGRGDDRAAVGQRAQHMDMRLVGARDRQAHRLRAGRQQQAVVGNGFAAGENHVSWPWGRSRRPRCRAADRSRPPRKNPLGATAASPRARCRRDSPSTDSADRPAPRRRCSASRCRRDSPAVAASRRRQIRPRRRRRSRSAAAHRRRL